MRTTKCARQESIGDKPLLTNTLREKRWKVRKRASTKPAVEESVDGEV